MKKITSLVLTAALVVSLGMVTAFAEKAEASISVNGTKVVFPQDEQKPYNDSEIGRVFVPLRATLNAFGYDDSSIVWNQEEQVVTTTDIKTGLVTAIDLKTQKYTITQGTGQWEGTLDVAPRVENGRTLVPIRAFSAAYFKNVDWEQDSQTVMINDVYPDQNIVALDGSKNNGLLADTFAKALVSTDGTYSWKVEDNNNVIFIGEIAEGVGNYSLFFKVPAETKGEVTLTLTPVKVDDSAVMPESKTFKLTIKDEENPENSQTGMPNPRTEYKSKEELEKALEYAILTADHLKDSSLKDPIYASITSVENTIGEVAYSKEKSGDLTIRTAKGDKGDITGVYGVTFKEKEINGIKVNYAIDQTDNICAAYFTDKDFTYSVVSKDSYTEEEFLKLIENLTKTSK